MATYTYSVKDRVASTSAAYSSCRP